MSEYGKIVYSGYGGGSDHAIDDVDYAPGFDAYSLRDDEFNAQYMLDALTNEDLRSPDGSHYGILGAEIVGGNVDTSGINDLFFMDLRAMRFENLFIIFNRGMDIMLSGNTSGVLYLPDSFPMYVLSRSRFSGPVNFIDQNGDGYQVILRGKDFYIMNI